MGVNWFSLQMQVYLEEFIIHVEMTLYLAHSIY